VRWERRPDSCPASSDGFYLVLAVLLVLIQLLVVRVLVYVLVLVLFPIAIFVVILFVTTVPAEFLFSPVFLLFRLSLFLS